MGNTKIPMIILLQANIINIVLDPILIFGWIGLPPMGVRGAAIASLVSHIYALGIYLYFILIKGAHIDVKGPWRLNRSIVAKSLYIGVPSGMNHLLLAANLFITYRVISIYGTAALASIGIGFRTLQAIYIPVIALASAMAAIVGQNFGANQYSRIIGTLWRAWAISMVFMICCMVVSLLYPEDLIGIFSDDPDVIHFGVIYLKIFSLGYVAVGTIMVVASAFQGLGKTYPSLIGTALDYALFAALVLTLPSFFGWGIQSVWWIKLVTAIAEMVVVGTWLRFELQRVRSNMADGSRF
jgi:putative MATE family efflux protein